VSSARTAVRWRILPSTVGAEPTTPFVPSIAATRDARVRHMPPRGILLTAKRRVKDMY
jgi:hypothetical protein